MAAPISLNAATAPTLNKHAALGVGCRECHGVAKPVSVPKSDNCSKCHGDYAKLKLETAKDNPNPHNAFHLGSGDIRCTLCHKNHAKSTLLCNQCHVESRSFDLKVP
jgi:hypothetical protein